MIVYKSGLANDPLLTRFNNGGRLLLAQLHRQPTAPGIENGRELVAVPGEENNLLHPSGLNAL
jgi:hypothetical protein